MNAHAPGGPWPEVARAFGTGSADYITYDGFSIMADNGVKMGGIIVAGNSAGRRTLGHVVKNMVFNGGSTIIATRDNREGIRLEKTTGATIESCELYSYRQETDWHNASAIKLYDNDYATVQNVEIYNSSVGLFLKRDTDDSVFRNNYLHDNYSAMPGQVYVLGVDRFSDNNVINNNVIVSNVYLGIGITQEDSATADNWQIYNNTIYDATHGVLAPRGDCKIWNNIIVNIEGRTIWRYDGNVLVESDHNQFGLNMNIINRIYTPEATSYTSLPEWQVSGELYDNSNPGVNSLASDPGFVSASGTLSELNDFRLAVSSSSRSAGRNGVDMGAFIDNVGVNANTIFMDDFE